MPQRYEYRVSLVARRGPETVSHPAGFELRTVQSTDADALAELMLDAYRNTTDYEGETLVAAVEEVRRYLSPESGDRPLLAYSVLLSSHSTPMSACLVTHWRRARCPLIGYVFSHPDFKRRGLARTALAESLRRLHLAGESEVRAVITEGNVPSERLFAHAGFRKVAHS